LRDFRRHCDDLTVAILVRLGLRGHFSMRYGGLNFLFAFEAKPFIVRTRLFVEACSCGIILAIAQSVGALIHPQRFFIRWAFGLSDVFVARYLSH